VRLFPGVHMSLLCILFLSLKMGVTDSMKLVSLLDMHDISL
jgi:hypothetical protein